jgi:MazG family protein
MTGQASIETAMQHKLDALEAKLSLELKGVQQALAVVQQLRNPEGGCPWDLEQTHQSLTPFMLEEAYEAVEAMQACSSDSTASIHALKDELGDVLLQVLLNSQIAQDAGHFSFQDVCTHLAEKLIERHPHVFKPDSHTAEINSPEAVTSQWQAIKARQAPPSSEGVASVLDGVHKGQAALARAGKISKKAVKAGFTWPDDETLWACVMSEFDEIKAEMQATPRNPLRLQDEMGDVFFACASLAKQIGVEPETALVQATAKFEQRFRYMESMILAEGRALADLDFPTWDDYWNRAKAELRSSGACR